MDDAEFTIGDYCFITSLTSNLKAYCTEKAIETPILDSMAFVIQYIP